MANMAMVIPLAQKNSSSSLAGHNGCVTERTRVKSSSKESDSMFFDLPSNFGEVVEGIYRSAFPSSWNLPALKKLGLKTIVTLVDEPYSMSHMNFLRENGIAHFRIVVQANKDPQEKTPDHVINGILEILLNKANHPILIHCNKGKHRTGCVVACFRKVQGWNLRDVLDEYFRYSWPKSRALDEKFIEAFDASKLHNTANDSGADLWKPTGNYRNPEADSTCHMRVF
ncbi:tyrosine phosphatase family-domain-containing protein [Aspergillus coremiiformis]|uniref:diphosphoinositol-polyphosphate diphosphatase n=1 Tax=Aspergillus coremiiformis TaxID=138285 RepID=A0A5N6Z8E3_9EURO|nr:tyrosine phosphatase family-domain-containing protein [Aspergillus coremiiformis]